MKKLFSSILIICLLLCSYSFLAQADNHSYELKPGKGYVVGKDISVGLYCFDFCFPSGRFYLYSSEDNFSKDYSISTEIVGIDYDKRYKYDVSLSEGQVVKVNQTGCIAYLFDENSSSYLLPEDNSFPVETVIPETTSQSIQVQTVNVSINIDGNDLSALTFEELILLREKLNLTIWNCQEWQEVTVPEGTYCIGEQIPAGHWTLRVAASHDSFNVCYFDKINEIGKDLTYGAQYYMTTISTSDFSPFGAIPTTEIDINMQEGWYIKLGGATVFTPYTGNPDFGFHQ